MLSLKGFDYFIRFLKFADSSATNASFEDNFAIFEAEVVFKFFVETVFGHELVKNRRLRIENGVVLEFIVVFVLSEIADDFFFFAFEAFVVGFDVGQKVGVFQRKLLFLLGGVLEDFGAAVSDAVFVKDFGFGCSWFSLFVSIFPFELKIVKFMIIPGLLIDDNRNLFF